MKNTYPLILIAVLLALFSSCAPAVPSPAPPSPATIQPAPAQSTGIAPVMNPEDVAWTKVVESAKKEGKVTIYAFGYTGEIGIQLRNAFKTRYNVDVEIITGRGAEFIERLKTERRLGLMVADLVEGSSVHLSNMKNSDLLEVASGMPSIRNKDVFNIDPVADKEGYLFNTVIFIMGPMINTRLVKTDEQPKSWQDMMDTKWKGKMMVSSPQVSVGVYQTFIPLLNAKVITLEWLRDISKQDLVFTRGDNDTAERLSKGDYPMALQVSQGVAGVFALEGAPIKSIAMAEGVTGTTRTIAQVKNGRHPNAARLFLDWILSPEGQTVYHKAGSTGSVRNDVQDFRVPAVVLPPTTRIIVDTPADSAEENQKFLDKWLLELWKK